MPELWKEIRGNALWDAIKWLWAMGGSGVTLAVQWIAGVIQHHQDLVATAITATAMIFFGIVAFVIHKSPRPVDPAGHNNPEAPGPPRSQEKLLREVNARIETAQAEAAKDLDLKLFGFRDSIKTLFSDFGELKRGVRFEIDKVSRKSKVIDALMASAKSRSIPEPQRIALQHVYITPGLSRLYLLERLGAFSNPEEKILKPLIDAGLLERTGDDAIRKGFQMFSWRLRSVLAFQAAREFTAEANDTISAIDQT
jgi:hypothetical protein